MGRYYINYHTGAGNEWIEGTLEDAKAVADNGAAYTQQPISIQDEDGNVVCSRSWFGLAFRAEDFEEIEEVDESELITFGNFGYYWKWEE